MLWIAVYLIAGFLNAAYVQREINKFDLIGEVHESHPNREKIKEAKKTLARLGPRWVVLVAGIGWPIHVTSALWDKLTDPKQPRPRVKGFLGERDGAEK